jgi:hypothetical protein
MAALLGAIPLRRGKPTRGRTRDNSVVGNRPARWIAPVLTVSGRARRIAAELTGPRQAL